MLGAPKRGARLAALLLALALGACSSSPNSGGNVPAQPAGPNKIVFASIPVDSAASQLFVMNPDGSGRQQISQGPGSFAEPVWSPDGAKIACTLTRDNNTDIYVINADGTGLARLTTASDQDSGPTWSPDGKRIAFVSDRDHNAEIYVMNADGTGQTRVTNNDANDLFPSWSPGGQRILFASYRDQPADKTSANDLFAMDPGGSNLQRLTNDLNRDSHAVWSPDGTKIVFSTFEGGGEVDGDIAGGELYIMNADGSGRKRLTPESVGGNSPSWSPDGQRVVFMSARNEKSTFQIYAINADGSGLTQLTKTENQETDPAWSR